LKRRYQKLTGSDIWQEAKEYIIQFKLLESDNLVCSSCNKPIKDPRKAVLHHVYYNQFYLFEPRNTTLVHYHCHENLHKNIEDQENSDLYM